MPWVWARNSAVTPIVSAPLDVRWNSLGLRLMSGVHGNVLHVLQAADDLHVFEAGHDGVRSLVDRLQAGAAQAVDGRAAGVRRQARHQPHDAGGVHALLALLLRIAEHDVFDFGRVDAGALDEGLDDRHGQVVGADVAKDALVFVGPANGRSHAIDNHGAFHWGRPFGRSARG